MITSETHKECPGCTLGQVFAYDGAEPEKCPTCNGTGFIELTDAELAMEHECKLTEGGLRKWL